MSDKYMKDDDYRNEDAKGDAGQKRKTYIKKKVCRFCVDKNAKLDYKEVDLLKRFVTEGGKIVPRRISGNCAKHQRLLAEQIKIARAIALLPYVKK
jgi:small subunit ribosomal protein S18